MYTISWFLLFRSSNKDNYQSSKKFSTKEFNKELQLLKDPTFYDLILEVLKDSRANDSPFCSKRTCAIIVTKKNFIKVIKSNIERQEWGTIVIAQISLKLQIAKSFKRPHCCRWWRISCTRKKIKNHSSITLINNKELALQINVEMHLSFRCSVYTTELMDVISKLQQIAKTFVVLWLVWVLIIQTVLLLQQI